MINQFQQLKIPNKLIIHVYVLSIIMTTQVQSEKAQAVNKAAQPSQGIAVVPTTTVLKPGHLHWGAYHRKPISFTFVFMIVAALVIWFASYKLTNWYSLADNAILSNSRMAVIFIMLLFGGMGALYLPDGLIKRPNEKIWKFITGLSMFYLMVLVYMAFLTKTETQVVLENFFDSSLGKTLPQKSYASDCRLYTPELNNKFHNLTDSFFDVFVVAHLVGWFFKVLICRDLPLVLFQSVLFEILEICLRHLLPNFWECWWDHVILDVLGANLLGIFLGWQIIKSYKLERLKWSLREGPLKKSFFSNMKQFWMSADVSKLEYKFLTSTKKFLQVMWFVVFMPLVDLTLFFNKFVLNIPPSHYINSFRTVLMGFLSINASKQYYHYITKRENEMRINAFMLQSIVLVEILIFFKNYNGQFLDIEAPIYAKIILYLFLGVFVTVFFKIVFSDIWNLFKNKSASVKTNAIKSQ